MTDPTPTRMPEGQPVDKRLSALLRSLRSGAVLRVTYRPDGSVRQVSLGPTSPHPDVVPLAVAAGAVVERRRRPSPLVEGGAVVEYVAAAEGLAAPVAELERKRAKKPVRVRRTTRPKAPPAKTASPTPDRASGPPANPEPPAKPRKRKPRPPKGPALPTSIRPLPDGTECVTREDAMARFGCTVKALQAACHKGLVDRGQPFRPPGRSGAPCVPIALTERTLAYARTAWDGGPRDRGPVALPPAGTEVLQRELFDLLGLAHSATGRPARALHADGPWRYRVEGSPRQGKLYRVGPELVAVLERLGWRPSVEPAPEPEPAPPWRGRPWRGRPVELVAGDELLQGEMLAALGMSASASNAAARAVKKLRRPGDGTAWLYRVDDALVGLLDELGFAVTVRPPDSSGDGAADVEDWRQLAATAAPTETPVFQ